MHEAGSPQVERRARQQEAVAQLGRMALATNDLDSLMQRAVNLVAETLDVKLAAVFRRLPGQDRYVVAAGVGWKQPCLQQHSVTTEAEWLGGHSRNGDALFVFSSTRRDVQPRAHPLLVEHGVVSGMSVGITAEPEPHGVIAAFSTDARDFTPEDVNFLQSLAHILASSIERQRSEELLRRSEEQFRVIFELAAVGEAQVEPHTGRFTRVNRKFCDITGYTQRELLGFTFAEITHPDHRSRDLEDWRLLVEGESAEQSGETRYIRKDGSVAWMQITATVVRDPDGQPVRGIVVAQDVTDRKRAEAELAEHRTRLEQQVATRTRELEDSHQRLRLSERMAALGTLSAGLGHDMGNLLLPVRLRLDAMEARGLTKELAEDVQAIRRCAEYLQRLVNGLRMFALDPDDTEASQQRTNLQEWWSDVQPFLKNALPREVALVHEIPPDLPPLAIARHLLTQAVFNLVQNSGEALQGRGPATVRVWAKFDAGAKSVRLGVTDDGPGMSADVKQRCIEPFFTTKTRGLSTGLGLALVHGIVMKVGGKMEIESEPDCGATFVLDIPVLMQGRAVVDPAGGSAQRALVSLSDARIQAYVSSVLDSLGFEVAMEGAVDEVDAALWIADASRLKAKNLKAFISANGSRRVVAFGPLPRGGGGREAVKAVLNLPEDAKPTQIRKVLQQAANELGAKPRRTPGE